MRTRDTTWQDKTTWGPGPWQTEPDKRQWQDRATGMPCLILRHERFGHWCGYVGVEPGHPLYGVPYDRCALRPTPCAQARDCDHTPAAILSVHGGVTFSGACQEHQHGICHEADPGDETQIWWLGFDCAHAGDLSPGMEATLRQIGFSHTSEQTARRIALGIHDVYRPQPWVMRECQRLALQLGDRDGMRRAADAT